jgi:iron complex outermembrane receptor protein
VQPSGRLLWMPHRRHVAWSAVSRAVRLPTRAESDGLFIQQVSPVEVLGDSLLSIVKVMGNPDFESEKLLAFEGGYRTRPTDWLTLDLAGFYNVYDDLRTGEPQNSITDFTKSPPHLIIPVLADNKASGRTFGIEKAVDCQVFERWRLRAAYTYLWMDVDIDRDSQSTGTETIPGKNPGHQFNLRSALDLPAGLGLDLIARGVGGVERPKEPNYWTVDFRLGWRPRPALEVVVAGQNLLDSPRHEFRAELIESPLTQIQRSLYGALKWRF